MKFRKKPIIIEAEQWFSGKQIEGVFEKDENTSCIIAPDENGIYHRVAYIYTLEGRMIVRQGDWIITGVNGEKYPCKPDIFEKTYERV